MIFKIAKRSFSDSVLPIVPGGAGTNASGTRIKRFYKQVTVVKHPKIG